MTQGYPSDISGAPNEPTTQFIDKLPEDIFREVLKHRVHSCTKPISPVVLLRVCRKWHNVAISTPALFTNILWYRGRRSQFAEVSGKNTKFKEFSRRGVICSSAKMLDHFIRLTGSLEFSLGLLDTKLDSSEWKGVDMSMIQRRCRVLHFWRWPDTGNGYSITNNLKSMVALEELHFHSGVTFPLKTLNDILLDVQSQSTRLNSLTLLMDLVPETFNLPLEPIADLLKRLERFKYTTGLAGWNADTAPFQTMQYDNLEELDVDMPWALRGNPPDIPKLRTLRLRTGTVWVKPLTSYTSVTNLSIHFAPPVGEHSQPPPVSGQNWAAFPELRHLSLHGSWTYIRYIGAPKLETLTLRGIPRRSEPREEDLRRGLVHNRPRILYMDMTLSEKDIVKLFKDHLDGIEELHVTTMNMRVVGNTFIAGFVGGPHNPPACPSLRILSLTYPVVEEDTSVEVQKKEREVIVNRLQGIIGARRPHGILQRVSVGWYASTIDSVLTDKNDLWNVEWRRLL